MWAPKGGARVWGQVTSAGLGSEGGVMNLALFPPPSLFDTRGTQSQGAGPGIHTFLLPAVTLSLYSRRASTTYFTLFR